MMDFQIKRTNRRCHVTERELKPGDSFYSELVKEDEVLTRRDISEEAWQGPAEDSIGWWKSRIPERSSDRVYWAPKDVLISYFRSLMQDEKTESAFVMALLLVRKKYLKLVDTPFVEDQEFLEIRDVKENQTWNVPVMQLTTNQIGQIQNELGQQLFMDQPAE